MAAIFFVLLHAKLIMSVGVRIRSSCSGKEGATTSKTEALSKTKQQTLVHVKLPAVIQ